MFFLSGEHHHPIKMLSLHSKHPTIMQLLKTLLTIIIAPLLASNTLLAANTPTVKTDKRFARGATMAFGRMSYTGVSSYDVTEQGVCYGECDEPTINDSRTTKYLENNGRIYWLETLKPATEYHMRAYVITRSGQVGYGEVCVRSQCSDQQR